MGQLGNGSITKISLNALGMSTDLLTAECLTLAVKAGVERPVLIDVMERVGANSEGRFDEDARWPATLFKGKFLPSRFFLRLAYNGWENHERTITATLQEDRANVKLRL